MLNKAAAAVRVTELPKAITATLTQGESQGRRTLHEWSADKYGTATVRCYLPEGLSVKTLNGLVLDYSISDTLAEDIDSLDRKRSIRARSVVSFEGKVPTFLSIEDDNFTATALIVVDVPAWASVETVTLVA